MNKTPVSGPSLPTSLYNLPTVVQNHMQQDNAGLNLISLVGTQHQATKNSVVAQQQTNRQQKLLRA